MGRKIDVTGQRFGKLVVLGRVGPERPRHWWCQCDCGSPPIAINLSNMRAGCSHTCGCVRRRRGRLCARWKGCGGISGTYWDRVVRQSAERGIAMSITIQDAWAAFESQGGICALTGRPISMNESGRTQTASLDRIDSKDARGYAVGNIQWVHKDVNRMKWHYDQDYFIELCDAVSSWSRRKLQLPDAAETGHVAA